MSSGPGSLSRHLHFSEFNSPLNDQKGLKTSAQRKALARGNLGLTSTAAEAAVLSGATPGTAVAGKAMVTSASNGIGGFRDTRSTPVFAQGAAGALNATGTLTAALLLGGIVTSTSAAAVTATLDTGTLLDTALLALYPGLAVNDYFEFSVINTGPNPFTIATATGWTDGGFGFQAVATLTVARFGVRRTAANTYTIFKIG